MKTFTRRQQLNIELGGAKRKRLVEQAEKAAGASLNSKFPHTYIYSPPGLGKTFSVERAVKETGIDYEVISGNQSMFAFGVKLAVINNIVPKDKPFVIIVDDCDEILKNEQNVNIMKNVLSGHRVYQYEKSLQSQWGNLSEPQQEAISAHSSDNQMGFLVPMERFVFIFTSNFKLPTDDEVQDARERGLQRANMKAHLNAIRSRCKPADFDLTKDEQWGWIADVIINENCVDLSEEDKMALLDWMDVYWDRMNERSIRTAEKMAEVIVDDPTGYRDTWEIDYLTTIYKR
jgi:hypothetical protein